MRLIDADKLLNQLPNDLPYKAAVKRVLAWAEIPKPPIPEEIRQRVKSYFGRRVEGNNDD